MSALARGSTTSARLRFGLVVLALVATVPVIIAPTTAPFASANPSPVTAEAAEASYSNLPLSFVPNEGQLGADVLFSGQAGGFAVQFTRREARLAFTGEDEGHLLGLRFLGANPAPTIIGRAPTRGKVNYLIGSDPAGWHTGLPTYGEVVYRDLWPGIDMTFRGDAGALKYEFLVAPGANPDAIRLAYAGSEGLSLDRLGNLLVATGSGPLVDSRPIAYQEIGGRRVDVGASYALAGSSRYMFALGAYDARRPLVVDPGLVYSTYLGGSGSDQGHAVAVDASGSAFVTGLAFDSTDFPTTPGAFDVTIGGGTDAFVTKLDPAGSALVYSTFLGGDNTDQGRGIAVDAAGAAYVTGFTASSDFPTTSGAFDTGYNPGLAPWDAFVTKLDPAGSALLYSTYLGGTSTDFGHAIDVDASGSAYVTGMTQSSDFPTTPGAFDPTDPDSADAFVTKLNPAGSAPLVYSTYLGGDGADFGQGIAVDVSGSAYVTGRGSDNFPTTSGAFDTTAGNTDAFVTKVDPAGASLLYSTFIGGTTGFDADVGWGIAVDGLGHAYVTGSTVSSSFPTTLGAYDSTFNGGNDAFVTKLNPMGSDLVYSTYLGGAGADLGFGVGVDLSGNAHVTGFTDSADFPTTPGAFDPTPNGNFDAFTSELNPAGTAPLVNSTYLGGSSVDSGNGIAVDASGSAYVAGFTSSADFPTTPGAYDTVLDGTEDAFVTKIGEAGAGPPATLTLDPPAATNPVGTFHTVTATVEDAMGDPVEGIVVRFTVTGSVSTSGDCTTDSNGQCDFSYTGPELPGQDMITAFADTDDDTMQDPGEPMGAATKEWVLPASTPGKVTGGGQILGSSGKVTFSVHAQNDDQGLKGGCSVNDQGAGVRIKCLDVTSFVVTGDHATIFGNATINGTDTDYRIDVDDLDEPGTGDTFEIQTSSGYSEGGTLTGGNIQIH